MPLFRLLALAVIIAAVGSASGCRHHVGYADVRMTSSTIQVLRNVGDKSTPASLEVTRIDGQPRMVRVYVYSSFAQLANVRHEFTGREVFTQYHWSCPLKIVLPVSLVFAIVMPFEQPHYHDFEVWGRTDYARDFVGWINPFEAWPGGKEYLGPGRVSFRAEKRRQTITQRGVPLVGASVTLFADGTPLVVGQTNDAGYFDFDLAGLPPIKPSAERETMIEFSATPAGYGEARGRTFVASELVPRQQPLPRQP
jgi:hypothetical protein